MSKADRAIKALRECADAMDAMPTKRISIFGGPVVSTKILREEADWLEGQKDAWEEAFKPDRDTRVENG